MMIYILYTFINKLYCHIYKLIPRNKDTTSRNEKRDNFI